MCLPAVSGFVDLCDVGGRQSVQTSIQTVAFPPPVYEEQLHPADSRYVAAVEPPNPATILFIDDDPVLTAMYQVALERAGYNVLSATNGQVGLELAATAHPDLIVLDVRMPILDGIEVLVRLAAESASRDIPVVMLSNYSESAVVKKALALGAKEYLVKIEVTPAQLADVVARWLSARAKPDNP